MPTERDYAADAALRKRVNELAARRTNQPRAHIGIGTGTLGQGPSRWCGPISLTVT